MNGLHFIGMVNKATKKYPITYLDTVELEILGYMFCLIREKNHEMNATHWHLCRLIRIGAALLHRCHQ